MNEARPPVLCLMGPTASGKTGLAVELVERLPVEIVSVDSAQVYRGMDIGTAKPDAGTLACAPHWLIDIRDPADAYSAADFLADARTAIADIHARGRLPLLTGGTMLYFHALEHGLAELPAADPELRSRLEGEAARRGWPALHERLASVDPATARRLHPNDAQRIQRALEVHALSGRPLSELAGSPQTEPLPFALVKWVVAPRDRQLLHERIAQRFRAMLEAGLIDEVAALRRRGDLDLSMPSMRSVGYRQVWQYLEGHWDHDELAEQGIIATRQFAKRQLTWLRRQRGAEWMFVEDAPDPRWLAQRAERLLSAWYG